MAKTKNEKLNALIFIDTNIFLDFYRIKRSDVSMKYLHEIETHKDSIITASQVEMEFKKNRQEVILETIGEVKKNININLGVPAILSDAKALESMKKSKKGIEEQQKRLRLQIEKILKNPSTFDPVYKSLQSLFKNNSEINLNRENKIRFEIRKLALKRFILGYPPKKKADNSIGDAIIWEWIINCSKKTGKHIIIVTRDTDFGAIYEGESYMNDWLSQEFKELVSQRRKLIITDKLSMAFKLVDIEVTQEMIEEEENVINLSLVDYQLKTYQEAIKRMNDNLRMVDIQGAINRMQDSFKSINYYNFKTVIPTTNEKKGK